MSALGQVWQSSWPERPLAWAIGFAALYWLVWQVMLVMPEVLTPWEDRIHLVYLPAFVRALAVVIAGFSGVLGVFLGTVLVATITLHDPFLMAVSQGFASAGAPLLAYLLVWLVMSRRPQPSVTCILLVGVLAAFFNAISHALSWSAYEAFSGLSLSSVSLMMLGDVLGVVLGAALFRLSARSLARFF
jgi:hypothetical protein